MTSTFATRVQARTVRLTKVSPVVVLVTVLLFPFRLLGWLVGVLFTVGCLLWAAGVEGFVDVQSRTQPRRRTGET